jgi:acetylornithine deacetylase/succinyl-diaminopimelate desuccinylase-like protein
MLEGSTKVNVIPPQATAQIDIRLLPGENPEVFLEEIQKVVGDDSIQVEPILAFKPTSSSPADAEIIQVIKEVARKHNPEAVVTRPLLVGFTDSHYFRKKGIPSYGFIPFKLSDQDMSLFHGNDERVSVDNVRFGTRMLYEIVRKLVVE